MLHGARARRRKTDELIQMIRELREPPPQPPRLSSIVPRKLLTSLNRAGSVANVDREPLGRAEGARLFCGDFDAAGGLRDSARSPVGQTGRLGSGLEAPVPLFRRASGIWVSSRFDA